MSPSIDIAIDETVTPTEIAALFAQTDWAKERQADDIATMLSATTLCISARLNGVLVGFLRVLTDRRFRAFIEDVIVDEAYRGNGIGRQLIHFALAELDKVQDVVLGCTEHNVGYYERFGFKRVGHAYMQLNRD